MNKKESFFRRLHEEGIPANEMPTLLKEVQEEEARERAPKTNPHKFENKRVQRLSDLWFSQRGTATVEQKDKVGLAYISKVLALGDEAAKRFAEGEHAIYHQVGLRQGGAENYTPALEDFWKRINEVFPNIHSDEDTRFLSEEGGVMAVWHFQWQLEIELAEQSPILRSLAINAHVYK